MRRLLTAILLIFNYFFSFSQSTKSIKETKEMGYPLTSIYSDTSYQELLALKPHVSNKTIVAMGEAAHGASEFFKTKVKVFEYLVTHEGFKVFAIESTFGSTYWVNDYITNGTGNVDEALRRLDNLYWNTQEVKDLIEWMKAYNVNKTDESRLKFYSFDVNSYYSPVNAIRSLF